MDAFRILSLSGGGFRGLYTTRVLKELEQKTGVKIRDQFDLIAGTSIGGIVALGIAAGIEIDKLEALFTQHGARIFSPRSWLGAKCGATTGPMYTNNGLKQVLNDTFKDLKIRDLSGPSVLVPACNVTTGSPKMFKTQHNPEFYTDADLSLVDIALATSAAPIYFPLHNIEGLGTFCDGGIVGNAPGGYALDEAELYMGKKREQITLLSIGTLSGKLNLSNKSGLNLSALSWMNPGKDVPILQMLMSQSEQVTHHMLSKKLGARYQMIDSVVTTGGISDIGLDKVDQSAIERLLSHAKADFVDFAKTPFLQNHLTFNTTQPA